MNPNVNTSLDGVVQVSPVNRFMKSLPFIAIAVGIVALVTVGAVLLLQNRTYPDASSQGTTSEIIYWGWNTDQEVMNELISEFETANPDIKVTYEKKAFDEYHEILKARLESGDAEVTPDVFEVDNEYIQTMYPQLSTSSPVDVPEMNQRFFPGGSKVCVQGGSVLCYPLNFDGLVMIYNAEALTLVGKEAIPDGWSDFKLWANQLTDKRLVENNGQEQWVIYSPGAAIGTGLNVSHPDMLLWLMMMQNEVPLDAVGEWEAMAETNGIAAAELYISFYEERIWDKSFSSDIGMFLSGRTPVIFGTVADIETILAADPAFTVVSVPPPQIDEVKNITHFQAVAVANSSPSEGAAWKWAEYLSSSEVQQKVLEAGVAGRTAIKLPSRRDLQREIAEVPGMSGLSAIFLTSFPVFFPDYEIMSADTIAAIEAMILEERPLEPVTALEELVEGLQFL